MAKQKKPKYIKPMPIIKNASTTTVANSFSMLASLDEEEEMKESEEVVPPPPTPAPTSTPTKTRKTRRPKMAENGAAVGLDEVVFNGVLEVATVPEMMERRSSARRRSGR